MVGGKRWSLGYSPRDSLVPLPPQEQNVNLWVISCDNQRFRHFGEISSPVLALGQEVKGNLPYRTQMATKLTRVIILLRYPKFKKKLFL